MLPLHMKKEWLFFCICFSVSLCYTEIFVCFSAGLYSHVLLCRAVIPILLIYTSSGIFSTFIKNNPGRNPFFRLFMYGSSHNKLKKAAMRSVYEPAYCLYQITGA